MEKTYDELNKELTNIQDKITRKNVELNKLGYEAKQIKERISRLKKETYDEYVGKYCLVKNNDNLYKTIMFVKHFQMSSDLTYAEFHGYAFIFSTSFDKPFTCSFHERYWINVISKNNIDVISKDDFERSVTESYVRILEKGENNHADN